MAFKTQFCALEYKPSGFVSRTRQLDYECDRGAIVEATATIDRTTFASSVCDGAIAGSGWLLL
eukprot:scaffold103230_cov41-Cyclotella_meneghiniana.AAC.1